MAKRIENEKERKIAEINRKAQLDEMRLNQAEEEKRQKELKKSKKLLEKQKKKETE